MQKVKPDPDGVTNTSELPKSTEIVDSAVSPLRDEPPDSPVGTLNQIKTTSSPNDPPTVVSKESQNSDKPNATRSLRPIAPKPCLTPLIRFNTLPTNPPNQPVPSSVTHDEQGFISFGSFERHLSMGGRLGNVSRADYADAIVPHHHINVSARRMLRLYQIVPKSRSMWITPNTIPSPGTANPRRQSSTHELPLAQPDLTSWSCSHQTVRSKRCASEAIRTADSSFSEQTSGSEDTSIDQPCASTESLNPGIVLNVNRLRPSAQLLTRIGRQLVEAQYKHLSIDECACGKVKHMDEVNLDSENVNKLIWDGISETEEIQLARRESSHLEWRPKPECARWNRVRALCGTHNCPFVPSTIFQLHRHLEQGHLKMVLCAAQNSAKESSVQPESRAFFAVPLIMNPHARITHKIVCPVCPDFKKPIGMVVSHIKQAHPFISANLFIKTFRYFCGICGSMINPKCSQLTASGSYVHSTCVPYTKIVRYAAWSNCDAHPVACLMLNPNRYSRLSMSESIVRQLYQSMDYVLSISVGRFRLWSVDSCTLRCSLAVSSLFGELIPIQSPSDTPLSLHSEVLETNPQTPTSLTAIGMTDPKAVDRIFMCQSSVTNSPGQLASKDHAMGIDSVNVSPSVSYPRTSISSRPPISSLVATQKRPYESQSTLPISSELPPKQPKVTVDEATAASRSVNGTDSHNTILVDLTNNPSDPSETDGASGATITPGGTVGVAKPNASNLPPRTTENCPNKPGSVSLVRISRITKEVCEICGAFARSCRQHLVEEHACQLGPVPTEFCLYCGRLFWTEDGCDNHQNVKCAVCSKEVCNTTLFIHLTEEHHDHFVCLLETRPIDCPVCSSKFDELSKFMAHGRLMHHCLLPKELCDRLPAKQFAPGMRGAAMSDLRMQQAQCKHSLRKRAATVDCVPSNIVTYDVSGSNLPLYSCSVCAGAFVSLTHLDFHIMLTGHQYWCASCPFACRKSADLISHHSAFHQIKVTTAAVTVPPSRLAQSSAPANGLHCLPNLVLSVPGPALPPSLPGILGQSQPSLTNQLHGCNMCPVFCLSIEDLNDHRLTVHKCGMDKQPLKTVNVIRPTLTRATVAPTVIVASGTTPISSTLLHYRQPNSVTGQRTRLVIPKSTPGLGTLLNIRSPVVARPASSTLTFPVRAPIPSAAPVTPAVGSFATPSTSLFNGGDELACPMCDFQSKNRAQVMQHIVDKH